MTAVDDEEIISLFFARSERAIAELSLKYGGICMKLSRNIVGSPYDADECVNDAYLGVWNTIPPRRPGSLPAYLCRIVRNISVKKYCFNNAKKRRTGYDKALEELEYCAAGTSSVEDSYTAQELAESINGFLNQLKKGDRVMFVKRYWFADSLSDISEQYGISRHNVSVRLFRIRKKLRKYLEKEGFLYE